MADIRVSGTRTQTQQGPTTISSPTGNINLNSTLTFLTGGFIITNSTGTGTAVLIKSTTDNVDNPVGFEYDPNNLYGTIEQRKAGAVYISGGVGIEKDLNVGGYIYGRISEATTSMQLVVTSTNIDATFYPTFVRNLGVGDKLSADNTGFNGGLTYNPFLGKLVVDRVEVASTDTSTSPTTGAFTVTGGAGILGDVYLGSNLNVQGNVLPISTTTISTSTIGSTSSFWYEGFIENLYTRVIASTTGTIQIRPEDPVTEIFGDIRVFGQKPIGTAPVVTNTLYVTVDGDDTNDGRAMDASRACRTIGGAVNSPYYQPGTQILVSAGHYLEDNPIRLKPYTSIRGSDIRTTFIEPINKTQDLFHLESGCYLNYMTFLNGRSGLLEGPYAAKFNRGAYATAFPPLPENERIDLFHSPYVQNCTNLSGPWLKDGTMFTPNQTVQVPKAVGTGTWAANTTSIIVKTDETDIVQGMSINAGQQNPGFFNARTLMLANKPFMQEQVINYVNEQVTLGAGNTSSIWYGFTYNQEKCKRDVGILVENVAYDAAFGGNQKAVESGLAYYNGVVSLIAGQELQTTAAINYLNSLTQQVILNTTCTVILPSTVDQVRNIVLTGAEVSTASITNLFGVITTIINNGPDTAPDIYTSTGPDAAFVSAEVLMQANRTFIQENTLNYINYNLCDPPNTLPYNKLKCRRDTGIIIDSIASDLLYPTVDYSQSTFAGSQYWAQSGYTGTVGGELTTTTNAIIYLRDLSNKIIQNITPADDLIPRYQNTATQVTNLEGATSEEVAIITKDFNIIIEIFKGNYKGWTDKIIPNGEESNLTGVKNAYNLLLANKSYMQDEVIAYIETTMTPGFTYNQTTCRRDIGYMVDSIAFDLLHGGNRQAIQSGLSYYSLSAVNTVIPNERTETVAAFTFLRDTINNLILGNTIVPLQDKVGPIITLPTATASETSVITTAIGKINTIISSGPAGITLTPISLIKSGSADVQKAYDIIKANKEFLKAETIAWIDQTYNPNAFKYDQDKCYRDVGLIVDAVSQDILLGGNQKSVEAGLSYWNKGYNHVAGQETTTTMAINYARDIALQVIANTTVTSITGTYATQVINPFFQYGGDYMPQQSVARNFGIITDIIENGPMAAPPIYAGGGLFALTGLNGADVKISPKVASVTTITTGTYLIGLNTATIGFGYNATLYFGDTSVFPLQDNQVEELSYEYTGNTSSWNLRKVDPIGAMGGSLVDGAVISSRSPIQSFVYDAFTQLTQGGHGVKITNNGYAQLVSVFTIFCSVGVQVDNGGIASIVNSNANFGNICLLAKGFGTRAFTGHLYNPAYKAYPESPDIPGSDYLDQYYPSGFWPNGGRVEVFLPDLTDRPHISLIMEIEPPEGHLNEQGLPGFLNASPNKGILTTGSIVISDIDTTGIAIGNYLYIRDQDDNRDYVATGTVVVDIGYRSVTLNKALVKGGQDPGNTELSTNDNWFDLYFCGNAYYSVLSSEVATNPKYNRLNQIIPAGINVLSTASTGWSVDQITPHDQTIEYLNTLTSKIIKNEVITPSVLNTSTVQTVLPLVTNGYKAEEFINQRYGEIRDILTAVDLTAAENVIPAKLRSKSGTPPLGASDAVNLISKNIDFLTDEVSAFVETSYYGGLFSGLDADTLAYIRAKCRRDTRIILQRLIYDIESGGRYNSVMVGLSYWTRPGSYHVVQLGENVRRPDLFPNGATTNFYQRSYISASGYVFEYVGAGINYGALPQVGYADPVQGKETVQLSGGKVFFTSTDQNGDFRIGPGLVISQATGVLSGRTFTKSLFANMTPFILAIEAGIG